MWSFIPKVNLSLNNLFDIWNFYLFFLTVISLMLDCHCLTLMLLLSLEDWTGYNVALGQYLLVLLLLLLLWRLLNSLLIHYVMLIVAVGDMSNEGTSLRKIVRAEEDWLSVPELGPACQLFVSRLGRRSGLFFDAVRGLHFCGCLILLTELHQHSHLSGDWKKGHNKQNKFLEHGIFLEFLVLTQRCRGWLRGASCGSTTIPISLNATFFTRPLMLVPDQLLSGQGIQVHDVSNL